MCESLQLTTLIKKYGLTKVIRVTGLKQEATVNWCYAVFLSWPLAGICGSFTFLKTLR